MEIERIPESIAHQDRSSKVEVVRARAVALTALASFGARSAALLIDLTVLVVVNALLLLAVGQLGRPSIGEALATFLAFVINAAYFAGLEGSSSGATLGKWALGIRVTDTEGRRIGYTHALGRFFGKLLSMAVLLIGFLMAAFTVRQQALHDYFSGTLVVRAVRNTGSAAR
ncbi:hypothetical protein BH23PLA1_BH23PLA1_22250 [soil metagenome]